MVYIKLKEPIKGFDIIRIKEIHFFDSDNNEITPISIGFRYQCCYEINGKYEEFYNKFITLDDTITIKKILENKQLNNIKSAYDTICMYLLEYLISKNIENGTLEVK